MKRFFTTTALISFVALSLTACPASGPSSSNPTASASPGSGASGSITTRAQVITYLNCLKTKNPGTAAALDVHISLLTNATDAQFAANGGAAAYLAITQGYERTGCI
jgi:hypothetical protein